MYQRPKLGETEDDLLRQEEEFLKASGKDVKWKRREQDDINSKSNASKDIVGNILEKNQMSLSRVDVDVKPVEGFPKPFSVDLAVSPPKKGRKSLFALHMEKKKNNVSKASFSEPMDLDNDDKATSTQSSVVSGSEAHTIHEENLRKIAQMSEAEILEEQKKLRESLDPKMLEFLKNRRKQNSQPVKDELPKPNEESKISDPVQNLVLDEEMKEKLTKYVDEKWVNIDFVEKEKLEWIGDIPDVKALEPDQSYSARFDFKGELQPFTAEIDVTKSLHHHGDEPERPGYTIQELYQLSRSTILQQRNLALNTLANIIQKTKLGYYDSCFDGALLHKLIESDLLFLLRFSIDENSLIPIAMNCLRRLLCSDTDEFALDKLLGVTDIDEQPLIFINIEVNENEEKELKDHVLISCDLIKGVLRTDMLIRLGYVLNNLNPNRETIINIITSLIRIARHSLEAAHEILKIPNLLNFIYSCVKSEQPVHQAVKLFRILVSHSKEFALEIYKNFSMSFLIIYVDAENISGLSKSEFYLLKLESLYLWRALLYHDLMIDDFLSWTPCFIRLLRFFIDKVDINENTDFDFELYSAISSIIVTCVRNRIVIDENYLIMMYVCLEKWLKELMQFSEYNYAGSKAIASAFRIFIAYFEVNGVNEGNMKFIKKINSVITSLICSKIFETMSGNLIRFSHLLMNSHSKRDPKNLPSLDSIYEGGNDYLKIIQNKSPLLFFIALTKYLKLTYSISHEFISAIELLVGCEVLREYRKKIFSQKLENYNWFMNFEKLFLVNLLDLYDIKGDDDTLKLGFNLLPYLRIDDDDCRRVLEIITNPKFWDLNVFDTFTKVLLSIPEEKTVMINYKNETIPENWMYKTITLLRGSENTSTLDILKFIAKILASNSELLKNVPYTLRYYHLSNVFFTDSNVLDEEILKYLKLNFQDIVFNHLKINLNKKVDKKKSFYDLYTELITQYAGLSYGEPLFSQFVLFPLQNRFDISFRKLLWSEYLHVLRVITIKYPVEGFLRVENFVEPCETDESLLVTYFNAVSNKVIMKKRNPFVYVIAVENVKRYLKGEVVDQKLYNFLKKKIEDLKDGELKADFVEEQVVFHLKKSIVKHYIAADMLHKVRFWTMAGLNLKYPKTLTEFGYDFDSLGSLRQIDPKTGTLTDKPYEFQVSSSHAENQERYEALGEVITEHVYKLLESEGGLKKLPLPKNSGENGSFVFASPDAFTNEKLMILIHGSGVVRAGQWARSLIINDNLKTGTQLPFIKKAKEENYSVLVLNSNDNERLINGKLTKIPGSEDPVAHVCTVWKDYVLGEFKADKIFIVAHSFGGVATLALTDKHFETFRKKVLAVAMTDSVHDFRMYKVSRDTRDFLKEIGRNWVASNQPVDTPIKRQSREDDIPEVSAGHDKHVMTSYCSMDSIFKFFSEKLLAFAKKSEL